MKKIMFAGVLSMAILLPLSSRATAEEREGRVQQRKENQQARIAQGVRSGQLTAGETGNLEHKESRLNREIRNDRAANGGTLTSQERQQVNRQQNRISRDIYRDKHNGRTQPH